VAVADGHGTGSNRSLPPRTQETSADSAPQCSASSCSTTGATRQPSSRSWSCAAPSISMLHRLHAPPRILSWTWLLTLLNCSTSSTRTSMVRRLLSYATSIVQSLKTSSRCWKKSTRLTIATSPPARRLGPGHDHGAIGPGQDHGENVSTDCSPHCGSDQEAEIPSWPDRPEEDGMVQFSQPQSLLHVFCQRQLPSWVSLPLCARALWGWRAWGWCLCQRC
jgi:hypothetical protein